MKNLKINKGDGNWEIIPLSNNLDTSSKPILAWNNGNTLTSNIKKGTIFFNDVPIITGLTGRVEVIFESDETNSTNRFIPSNMAINKTKAGMSIGTHFIYQF